MRNTLSNLFGRGTQAAPAQSAAPGMASYTPSFTPPTSAPRRPERMTRMARDAYGAQHFLLQAQREYGPAFAVAEADAGAARAAAEARGVAQVFPQMHAAAMGASPEYAQGVNAYMDRTQAGAGIYGQLEEQAQEGLALGGRLSADEQRAIMQGTRAAWNDRGLATSGQAAVDELLGRSSFAQERLRERQGFAAGVASGGQQFGVNALNAASAAFDPFNRVYGTGGSQVSGALTSSETFAPYGQVGASLHASDTQRAIAAMQIEAQKKMQNQQMDYGRWATEFNAGEAARIGQMNARAGGGAGFMGLIGSLGGSLLSRI